MDCYVSIYKFDRICYLRYPRLYGNLSFCGFRPLSDATLRPKRINPFFILWSYCFSMQSSVYFFTVRRRFFITSSTEGCLYKRIIERKETCVMNLDGMKER